MKWPFALMATYHDRQSSLAPISVAQFRRSRYAECQHSIYVRETSDYDTTGTSLQVNSQIVAKSG